MSKFTLTIFIDLFIFTTFETHVTRGDGGALKGESGGSFKKNISL